MLWSKAIQHWTAVSRRFTGRSKNDCHNNRQDFSRVYLKNSSTKRENYSNSRVTRGICAEVLINLQLFEEIRNFTAHRNSSSLIKNAVWRVDIEGFSPSVNLWFVAGSMWLMSRTQSHSTCWGLRQNKTHKKRVSLYIFLFVSDRSFVNRKQNFALLREKRKRDKIDYSQVAGCCFITWPLVCPRKFVCLQNSCWYWLILLYFPLFCDLLLWLRSKAILPPETRL